MKIGLVGGAFDPVHIGHLACASRAAARFGLDRVIFVPTAVPPHKKQGSASAADRLAMVRRAVRPDPRFAVSRHEMDTVGPSYTIDTVRWFKKTHGDRLYYIIGLDAFADIHSWRSSVALLNECNFIVAARPGSDMDPLLKRMVREFRGDGVVLEYVKKPRSAAACTVMRATGSRFRVYLCPFPGLDVSSTEIRRMAAAGEPINYLVPEVVAQYISKQGLYRG